MANRELTTNDREKYLIFDQTHTVVNPQDYFFLSANIKFLAFKKSETDSVLSVVLYLEANQEFIDTLESQFGNPISILNTETTFESSVTQQISYESRAWKDQGYVMLASVIASENEKTWVRIWIRN